MVDENAYGILISNAQLEDEEYASDDLSEFVDRVGLFRRLVLQHASENPPGPGTRVLDLGHAVYVELPEEGASGLLAWAKALRATLTEHEFTTTVIITHGGRWVAEAGGHALQEHRGTVEVISLQGPSEPLRRALFAHTASHGLSDEDEAWGPALYLDTEAAESLNIRPKNEPTILSVAGATFLRVGR